MAEKKTSWWQRQQERANRMGDRLDAVADRADARAATLNARADASLATVPKEEGRSLWTRMVDAAPVASFEGATLYKDRVQFKRTRVPLPATAHVETAGEVRRRITATRLVATGVFAFALRKKKDDRELYLTVEGDGEAFVLDVDPKKGKQAREFAAKVNAARSN